MLLHIIKRLEAGFTSISDQIDWLYTNSNYYNENIYVNPFGSISTVYLLSPNKKPCTQNNESEYITPSFDDNCFCVVLKCLKYLGLSILLQDVHFDHSQNKWKIATLKFLQIAESCNLLSE